MPRSAPPAYADVKLRLTLLLLIPVLLGGIGVAGLLYLLTLAVAPEHAWRIAVGVDQLVNVATGGSEDETISSRAYRASQRGVPWACQLCRILDLLQQDHCKKSAGT